MGLLIFTLWCITKKVGKEIQMATEIANQIASGNFNIEIQEKDISEIASLGNAFSEIVKELSNYQGYIEEVAQILTFRNSIYSIQDLFYHIRFIRRAIRKTLCSI